MSSVSFVIPSIFTAVDKYSGTVNGMGKSTSSFASRAEASINRVERGFNKITPALSGTAKHFLAFAETAAIAGGVIATAKFSVDAIMDYQNEIANLSAVTGASGADLDKFKSKIIDTARATGESSVNVAKAFTVVGNAQPDLLKSADALAAVTESSIILSQAAKMELAPAADALTGIMNQFNLGAKDAKSTIDLLAAGSVIGSSEIIDTANAIGKAGAVAANNGLKVVEVITALETISGKIKGEEAGTQLKNIFATMSAVKVQDPKALADLRKYGVNLSIVQSKVAPLSDRLKELSKIKGDTGALTHVFGKENLVTATSLLNSTEKYSELLDTIQNSDAAKNAAAKMAATNNDTLSVSIQRLKNKWVTLLTSSDKVGSSLYTVNKAVKWITENMETIVKVGFYVLAFFAALKILLLAARVATIAFGAVSWIYTALTGEVGTLTLAQGIFNTVLLACPIFWIIALIVLLIAYLYVVINKWNEWGAALILFSGVLGIIINLVQSFRRNWDAIKQSFKEGGILSGLKAIAKTLLDGILMPLQQILSIIGKVTGFDWASDAAKSIGKFRDGLGVNVTTDENGDALTAPKINSNQTWQDALLHKIETNNSSTVDLNINDKGGWVAAAMSSSKSVNINTSSTFPPSN